MTERSIFDFDRLHEQAITASGGLSDFGMPDYQEGLRLLLAGYETTARLNERGVTQMAGAVVSDLAGRLHEEEGYKTFPELLNTPIRAPIIITGIPRSGTTVFHRLISQGPATQSMPMWLANNPMPRPQRHAWESNPFYRQVEQGLEAFAQLSSNVMTLHPQHAATPDECRILLNHTFAGPSLPVTTNIPDYERWILGRDLRSAYRRHRSSLGLISAGSEARWILKCPSHIWALDALLDVYPDACVVITHRDPIKAMPSLLGLVQSVREHIEMDFDLHRFGHEHLGVQRRSLLAMERARELVDTTRIFDVHCDEAWSDPISTVERIYEYFDIPVTNEARISWQRQIDLDPAGGHAAQHTTPEAFGLTTDEVLDAAGAYSSRFRQVNDAYRERRAQPR